MTEDYVKRIQTAARNVFLTPLSTRVEVLVVFADTPSRPDVDNVMKLVCDSLKGIVYRDDRQIEDIRVVTLGQIVRQPAGEDHRTFNQLLKGDQFLIRIVETARPSIAEQLRTT